MPSPDYSRMPIETLVSHIPVWLEIEALYANAKYDDANPQRQVTSKEMTDMTSAAYQEFPNYFGRFLNFYRRAEGDEQILLNASLAVGKFMSAGRALVRVLIESDQHITRHEADVRTFEIVRDIAGAISVDHAMEPDGLRDYFGVFVEPNLARVHREVMSGNASRALSIGTRLLATEAQLFAGFSATTGVMAEPGVSSSDRARHWAPPEDLLH